MSTFLKRSRESAGITQAQLAEKMGVSTVAVQNWESGKTNISYGRYQDLAVILNIPVDKLIKETIIDEDKTRLDNWPDFLFDENTNELVDMLHLNMAQQDLFGLLYAYPVIYFLSEVSDYPHIVGNSQFFYRMQYFMGDPGL